jgi:hypothetical protein
MEDKERSIERNSVCGGFPTVMNLRILEGGAVGGDPEWAEADDLVG